ncbi:MAG TPA: class I SAM-dependent methyltransferase [Bryobacteraceae bacterium]|nr:class I SAM-dependent methyltransferase [Bryobacteraceae bacterium]
MIRTPEPELMVGEEQARAYAAADLSELQASLVDYFRQRFGDLVQGTLLDLGCGAADVAIRFATAFPGIRIVGVDGSAAMLEWAHDAVREAGLSERVRLEQRYLPDASLDGRFDVVIANSLLHHLPDPLVLWRSILRCARSGAPVMVMDLRRPADRESAKRLVKRHGWEAPEVLRCDFFNSLCAAYKPEEVRHQIEEAGLPDFHVQAVGELHVLAWGYAPGN